MALQAAEDPEYSVLAKVDLRKMFGKRTVSIILFVPKSEDFVAK